MPPVVMERFFWSLKHEWTKHESFENLEDARWSVFKYIETFYNRERLHQTLGYLSPDMFEALFAQASAARYYSPPLSKSPGLSHKPVAGKNPLDTF